MGYWLIKSEPSKGMWKTIQKNGLKGCFWKRVRNFQARNYMKQMKKGDQCFFYHSVDEKQIIASGIYYLDENKNKYVDRFRNRIIFPVRSLNGSIFALGGRTINKTTFAKYINCLLYTSDAADE